MRETQLKGDIATTQAIATFTRLGFDVSIPITESAAYDLVVDSEGLKKVQVKYCGRKNFEVDLRQVHMNSNGKVTKYYSDQSFDWLYVYRSDGEEFLFTQNLSGRTSILAKNDEDNLYIKLGRLAERFIAPVC